MEWSVEMLPVSMHASVASCVYAFSRVFLIWVAPHKTTPGGHAYTYSLTPSPAKLRGSAQWVRELPNRLLPECTARWRPIGHGFSHAHDPNKLR